MSSGPSPTLSTSELSDHEQSWQAASSRCSKCSKPGFESSMKRCHTCFLVVYCSPRCQRTHSELHMSVCKPRRDPTYTAALGLRFRDNAFESFRDLQLGPCVSTPQTRGWLCPATELIGLPIYIAPANETEYAATKDLTSVCHYLMMDPDTGFAMDSWTTDVRHKEVNYCAFNYNQHPLTEKTLETVLAFLKTIVENVSGLSTSDGWASMRCFLTREAFQLFSRMYWAEQARNTGREGWQELAHPLL